MPTPIISVENLSKAFRIGAKEEVPDTITQAALGLLKSPLKNLRNLKNLDTSSIQNSGEQKESASDSDILWAFRDVSFEVNQGDVVGVIGRNGAGKSTLLKVLSRITEPTSGRAIIRGRVSSLLEVGTGFHPELTGRENIYMNGTILGMTKREIDSKFDEIVDFSGVERFLDTPTKRYSSGMQVRLAFAVAAHLEPEVLVVDEVLAVGDLEFQKKCLDKMKNISSEGRTVLFVSHNMSAIESLCNRVVGLGNHTVAIDSDVGCGLNWYMSSNNSGTGIHDSIRREGSGKTRLTDIAVRPLGDKGAFIKMGDGLEITLTLESQTESEISIGIALLDQYGSRLMRLNMEDMGIKSLRVGKMAKIVCSVPQLNLLPAQYGISVGIVCINGLRDFVPEAVRFQIHPAPILPTGIIPDAAGARMFSVSDWTINS